MILQCERHAGCPRQRAAPKSRCLQCAHRHYSPNHPVLFAWLCRAGHSAAAGSGSARCTDCIAGSAACRDAPGHAHVGRLAHPVRAADDHADQYAVADARLAYTDSHAAADRNTHRYADRNTHRHAHCYADSHSHGHGHGHACAADRYPSAYRYAYTDAHPYANGYAYAEFGAGHHADALIGAHRAMFTARASREFVLRSLLASRRRRCWPCSDRSRNLRPG